MSPRTSSMLHPQTKRASRVQNPNDGKEIDWPAGKMAKSNGMGWMGAFSDWFTVRDQRKCKRTDFVLTGSPKERAFFVPMLHIVTGHNHRKHHEHPSEVTAAAVSSCPLPSDSQVMMTSGERCPAHIGRDRSIAFVAESRRRMSQADGGRRRLVHGSIVIATNTAYPRSPFEIGP